MYVWGGDIKKGARPYWCRGMFVLVISNVNFGYQKSLNPPLKLFRRKKNTNNNITDIQSYKMNVNRITQII